MNATTIDIAGLIRQIPTQYPFVLVDRVLEHDPAGRLVAVKNVTGSEEFFEGHFPGAPARPRESGSSRTRPIPDASRSTWSGSTTRSSAVPPFPATSSGSRSPSCTGG